MYGFVLLAHSWNRWLVLVLGVAVLADQLRSRRWVESTSFEGPTTLHRTFIRSLDLQFVLGLLLYVALSPWTRVAFGDMGAAMGNSVLRFYSVEHAFGMLVAVGAAHGGFDRLAALGKRGAADGDVDMDTAQRAERRAAVTQIVWLVVTLVSIPWPGLAYGRPLGRFGF